MNYYCENKHFSDEDNEVKFRKDCISDRYVISLYCLGYSKNEEKHNFLVILLKNNENDGLFLISSDIMSSN